MILRNALNNIYKINITITNINNYWRNLKMNNQSIQETTGEEQVKGLCKTGVLKLKEKQDRIEYHLYNNKLPYPTCCESVDVNGTFDIHLYKTIKHPIQLSIECANGFKLEMKGKLLKKTVKKIDKYYFEGQEDIDIENFLFENTEQTLSIKIHTVHKDSEEGVNTIDEA